jgi:PTH1 family peptidyl-tRNA hydrolase
MNLSGSAVGPIARYHKIKPEEILVVHDDIAFEPGQIRLSFGGSGGGHNGICLACLGAGGEVLAPALGVGAKPHGFELPDWVLGQAPR